MAGVEAFDEMGPAPSEPGRSTRRWRAGSTRRRPTCLPRAAPRPNTCSAASASPSASMATRTPPSGSSLSTSCRASSRAPSGGSSRRGSPSGCRALNLFLDGRVRRARDPQGGDRPARTHPAQPLLPAGDDRPPRAARHLGPHRRHRHRAGRRRVVLRAGGQRAHAVRRLLHAGKPRSDDAAAAGPLRPPPCRAGRRLSRTSCSPACARSRRGATAARRRS